MISLSNTGKNVTIYVPNETASDMRQILGDRYAFSYNRIKRRFEIKPADENYGRKLSKAPSGLKFYSTLDSIHPSVAKMPKFGRIEGNLETDSSNENWPLMYMDIPATEILPPREPRIQRKKRVVKAIKKNNPPMMSAAKWTTEDERNFLKDKHAYESKNVIEHDVVTSINLENRLSNDAVKFFTDDAENAAYEAYSRGLTTPESEESNVLIVVEDQTLKFNLPAGELLKLALQFVTKGYTVS